MEYLNGQKFCWQGAEGGNERCGSDAEVKLDIRSDKKGERKNTIDKLLYEKKDYKENVGTA